MNCRFFRLAVRNIVILTLITLGGCASDPALVNTATTDPKLPATEALNALQVSDISMPPGAKLDAEKSLVIGSGERWLGRLVIKTELSTVQAYNHFYNGMPTIGWSLIAAVQSKLSHLSYQRGDRVVFIQIEPVSFGGVTITMTMTPRQGAVSEPKNPR